MKKERLLGYTVTTGIMLFILDKRICSSRISATNSPLQVLRLNNLQSVRSHSRESSMWSDLIEAKP